MHRFYLDTSFLLRTQALVLCLPYLTGPYLTSGRLSQIGNQITIYQVKIFVTLKHIVYGSNKFSCLGIPAWHGILIAGQLALWLACQGRPGRRSKRGGRGEPLQVEVVPTLEMKVEFFLTD
jgi:hypothetical protein